MARFARIVVPGVPHHVTQRGVRGMRVFFSDTDYSSYLSLLARQARRYTLDIWAYCLLPNHVHLIAVPVSETGLARPLGEAHRRYATQVNRRFDWTGHLWQERFSSFPMDEPHLLAAIRYVLLNPVRAGLAQSPTDWRYSSAKAHVLGCPDSLVNTRPARERVADWEGFLAIHDPDRDAETIRRHTRIGRPLGSSHFVDQLESATGRRLRPSKVGRKPKRK